MVFLFIKAEAMVVRFGTLAPLKTPIKVLTVVVQSASTLLSMDVISGSVQRARRELLYPIILSSSGMEIPAAIEEIRNAPIRHTRECDADQMKKTVKEILGVEV